ncbi:MAG: hypothetical protein AAB802_01480 [Patescibacteria group bacterium]
MTSLLPLLTIAYVISMITFLLFSSLAIRHAARFRYLSTRTVWLTLFFVGSSSALFLISLIVLITIIVWL